ncbi:hypothetical protein BDK51DRAFT_35382 [Blyttiomyces helicus]|uniref:Uncharacterized protein n=1 Tax=Blyttiomyces helicus TaxID=388810 RepID=A0A4P9WKL7_9FUNG|nr:hypothetical protein BDK51DRAFT_35382 [Blyttiomyces helicus]|eukprot:RKO93531.1 hypothetical protein BDK51DRAFT_35382 [Blyttiomyces helicus]
MGSDLPSLEFAIITLQGEVGWTPGKGDQIRLDQIRSDWKSRGPHTLQSFDLDPLLQGGGASRTLSNCLKAWSPERKYSRDTPRGEVRVAAWKAQGIGSGPIGSEGQIGDGVNLSGPFLGSDKSVGGGGEGGPSGGCNHRQNGSDWEWLVPATSRWGQRGKAWPPEPRPECGEAGVSSNWISSVRIGMGSEIHPSCGELAGDRTNYRLGLHAKNWNKRRSDWRGCCRVSLSGSIGLETQEPSEVLGIRGGAWLSIWNQETGLGALGLNSDQVRVGLDRFRMGPFGGGMGQVWV